MDILEQLPEALLPWFDKNKRDLPWRQDNQPYHVWLSEIMLQQTRVEAVKGYYNRFLEALPTIEALSECDDDRLHKLWEGLGYYSRVRNLKKAARTIVNTYGGRFPEKYDDILALAGIGEYTAGAICSISFQQKTPAVDGNVLRVYTRLLNDDTPIGRPDFKVKVRKDLATVYPERAGDFTQALMELGATLCGPNWAPRCESCPCNGFCRSYMSGTSEKLPVKTPKKPKTLENKTVFILRCEDEFALMKRPEDGLLASMWQFPDCEGTLTAPEAISRVEAWEIAVLDVRRQSDKKHIFTHIVWNMRGFYMEVGNKCDKFSWFTAEEIAKNAALPTAFRQFWEVEQP